MEKYEKSVFEVCDIIHGSYCGTGDGQTTEKLIELRNFLLNRIEDWSPAVFITNNYDTCVLNLLKAAVIEADLNLVRREEYEKRLVK